MTKSIEEHVEEMKAPETFNLSDALSGVTRPKDEVTVYLDGERAQQLDDVLGEISEIGRQIAALPKTGGITGNPEEERLQKELDELNELVPLLVDTIKASALTFHLRGLAPKQTDLIVKSWEKKLKPESKQPTQEELADIDEDRSKKINAELIAKCTVKIVNGEGKVSTGALSIEAVEALRDEISKPEYNRLVNVANGLCVAGNLFNSVMASDADFLSKP